MQIISNYHWRNFIYGYELTDSERMEFDYIPSEDIDSRYFIRYRGIVYDIGEFMRVPHNAPFNDWSGYHSDSYFSAIAIRYSDDVEQYQVGLILSFSHHFATPVRCTANV